MVDDVVTKGQDVTKGDDSRYISNPPSHVGIDSSQSIERLTDDLEVSFGGALGCIEDLARRIHGVDEVRISKRPCRYEIDVASK